MVTIFNTKEEIANHAADIFVAAAQNAIQDHIRFVVALAGGSSAMALYKFLATPEYQPKVDWSKIFYFLGRRMLNCEKQARPAINKLKNKS